jgi:four helix bundle protein
MKGENPVQTKSYAFALRIVKLYRYLCVEKKEFVLSKQIMRSGALVINPPKTESGAWL